MASVFGTVLLLFTGIYTRGACIEAKVDKVTNMMKIAPCGVFGTLNALTVRAVLFILGDRVAGPH